MRVKPNEREVPNKTWSNEFDPVMISENQPRIITSPRRAPKAKKITGEFLL